MCHALVTFTDLLKPIALVGGRALYGQWYEKWYGKYGISVEINRAKIDHFYEVGNALNTHQLFYILLAKTNSV